MRFFTKREFIKFLALLVAGYPMSKMFASDQKSIAGDYPVTIEVLKEAFITELTAHENYNGFCLKAIEEDYPNIAYFFRAFSISEKVHAENYKRILSDLGTETVNPMITTTILSTKKNLQTASQNELAKIKDIYPGFIKRLRVESYDQAVINCMYSWRSHEQHRAEMNDIHKYSKLFAGHVMKEIEEMELEFNVCDICGSTLMEEPQGPCHICNYPLRHYQSIKRPTA